ncbi:hypothetical protein EDD22DRAFT_850515 [Suillus occidentalis]|nr:hypothetical protein EDD22DRAFT_850515 [Suillus occidentalis]
MQEPDPHQMGSRSENAANTHMVLTSQARFLPPFLARTKDVVLRTMPLALVNLKSHTGLGVVIDLHVLCLARRWFRIRDWRGRARHYDDTATKSQIIAWTYSKLTPSTSSLASLQSEAATVNCTKADKSHKTQTWKLMLSCAASYISSARGCCAMCGTSHTALRTLIQSISRSLQSSHIFDCANLLKSPQTPHQGNHGPKGAARYRVPMLLP